MKDMQNQAKYQEAVNEFVRRALRRYEDNIDSIILFGSVARGEAKEDSDIDILVVIKKKNVKDMKEIYGIAFEVSMEYLLDVSPKVYGMNEISNSLKIGVPFIKEVLKEGVSVYGGFRTSKITA